MPKKTKKKKNSKNNNGPVVVRSLLTKTDGQEYARVEKMLGDRQVWLYAYDGQERRGKIRGNMRKRCWITPGDHVLISLRDFSENCVDVIHKYNDDEVRRLKKSGELVDLGKQDDLPDIDETSIPEDDIIEFDDL